MANYLTTDIELTSIANAIRTKGGTQADLVYPTGFVSAINDIPTGGGGTVNLTGVCDYAFFGNAGKQLIDNITFTTNDITTADYMFMQYTGATIPFTLNFSTQGEVVIRNMFNWCQNLTTIPTLNLNGATISRSYGFNNMFQNCYNIQNIPDFLDGVDLSFLHNSTGNMFGNMFNSCSSLTSISPALLGKLYNKFNTTNRFQNMFNDCISLTALNNFAAFGEDTTTSVSTNVFQTSLFARLKSCSSITFSCNGTVRLYSNQDIQLTGFLGYSTSSADWSKDTFSGGHSMADSVYDHDSLVETIASLPDTSSVSPPANPTNKLTIQNGLGANSVNGGVNDLTAEEIAAATNKGWALNYIG